MTDERHRALRESGMPTWSCSCGDGPFPYEGALAMTDAFDQHVADVEAFEAWGAFMLDVANAAISTWHRPVGIADGEGHTSFNDSLALTHCICFGAMAHTLTALRTNPDLLDRLTRLARALP